MKDFLSFFPMNLIYDTIPAMQKRMDGKTKDRRITITKGLLLKWIGITILLSVYKVTGRKLFQNKSMNLPSTLNMSYKVYQLVWSVFKPEDITLKQKQQEGA